MQEYSPPSESSYTAEQSFSSCFISYSSRDKDFAQKLATGLRTKGVPIWYAHEDILPGDKIYDQAKKAIASFDRLLVVLSSDSMKSNWVQTELASALAREHREGRRVIFPVSVVPIDVIRAWECVDPDAGIDIAREIRSYHIPDFSNWANAQEFERQLAKVVKALQGSAAGAGHDADVFRLKQELRAAYPGDRAKAARGLAKLGKAAGTAVPALRKALRDSSEQVRNAAAAALAAIGTTDALSAPDEFEGR